MFRTPDSRCSKPGKVNEKTADTRIEEFAVLFDLLLSRPFYLCVDWSAVCAECFPLADLRRVLKDKSKVRCDF